MQYQLRSLRRELSLAVLPVDTYSGKPARGIRVTLDGLPYKPVAKPDGRHIFLNLPGGSYTVCLEGEGFFPESIKVSTGENAQVTVRMIPGRGYPVSPGMTWLEGELPANTLVYVTPESRGFRLARCEGGLLTVNTRSPYSLENSCVAIGKPQEYLWAGERVDTRTYRIDAPPAAQYTSNLPLNTVSLGRADPEGSLFCPIRRFLKEDTRVWIDINGKIELYPVVYGTANSIKFR